MCVQTNYGRFTVTLWPDRAPASENFLSYVDYGFYEGLIFHRVIPCFMVQAEASTPRSTTAIPSAPSATNR